MTADQALAKSAKEVRQTRMVGGSPDGKRHRDDFYPTPPEATRALLSVEKFDGLIWEPACGDGAMSRVLQDHNPVMSTDLVDRGFGAPGHDFLMQTRVVDNVVTNPPFKLLLPFTKKALELSRRKVAFLARITALEGIERSRFMQNSPLKSVYVFSRRLTFNRGEANETHGGGMLAFCWLVWDHEHSGPATIGWLDAKEFMDRHPLFDDERKCVKESETPEFWDESIKIMREKDKSNDVQSIKRQKAEKAS